MQSSIGHLELKNSTKALGKIKINNSRMPALSLANGVFPPKLWPTAYPPARPSQRSGKSKLTGVFKPQWVLEL